MEASATPCKKTRSEIKLEKNPPTMKYQYQGQSLISKFGNEVQWVTNTEIGPIEIEDTRKEVAQTNLNAPYRRIKRSRLVEATIFPQAVQSHRLILTIAQHYNKDTRKCRDTNGNIVVDHSLETVALTFGILQSEKVLQTTEEEAINLFNQKATDNKFYINEAWMEEPRISGLKAFDNILRAYFKVAQMDLIIMLNCAFGKPNCRHYHL